MAASQFGAASLSGCIEERLHHRGATRPTSHFEGSFTCGRQMRHNIPEKQRLHWTDPPRPMIHCTSVMNQWQVARRPMLEHHAETQLGS